MLLETEWMKDQRIPVMMASDEVAMIDEWRRKHPDLPSRSEAIRQLIQLGLKAKGK
jgi:metal-responsive CopG/Arc/MetJ family transcriptional regulator